MIEETQLGGNYLKSTIMTRSILVDNYLFICKELDLKDIIPAKSIRLNENSYIEIKKIAEELISIIGIESFSSFLLEGQYLVQLWTAHLILIIGTNNSKIKNDCIQEIINYSTHPLFPDLAKEEFEWLKMNELD
jgi:hypothetical protein